MLNFKCCSTAFQDLSKDSKQQLVSQLHLPIQRLVDYKVILSDLHSLSPHQDLNRAVDFIETLEPSRNDDFLQSIEGFSGDIRKLGKLVKHVGAKLGLCLALRLVVP